MQQRDQSGPALILNGAFPLDPGADLARRPRQRLGDPGFQLVLLFGVEAAGVSGCRALEPRPATDGPTRSLVAVAALK